MNRKQVKCIECGYLGSLVNYTGEFEFREITPQARLDLGRWSVGTGKPLIRCRKGQAHTITGVIDPLEHIDNAQVIEAVQIPRECSYYHPFEPGHSPENHLKLAEDKKQQSFLIRVSLVSAVVGAIIGGLIGALID